MMKSLTLALALSTSLCLAAPTVAAAQTDLGIPYEITFQGDLYPAGLDTMDYPYLAASQERDGECLLELTSDTSGQVTGVSILNCSDTAFRKAAERYINGLDHTSAASNTSTHTLKITWTIGHDLDAQPLQLATR